MSLPSFNHPCTSLPSFQNQHGLETAIPQMTYQPVICNAKQSGHLPSASHTQSKFVCHTPPGQCHSIHHTVTGMVNFTCSISTEDKCALIWGHIPIAGLLMVGTRSNANLTAGLLMVGTRSNANPTPGLLMVGDMLQC